MPTENETPRSVGPDTFIRERKRGRLQGEQDLLARLGYKDADEAIREANELRRLRQQQGEAKAAPKGDEAAAVAAAKKEAPREPGETKAEYDARLKELLAEALGPIHKRFADEDAVRKKSAEEAEAKRRAEEEQAAGEKKLKSEVRWFHAIAKKAGAAEDEKKLARLTRTYQAELAAMSEEDFEDQFGEDVPEEERAKNARKILEDIRADAPGLFKAAEDKAQPKVEEGKGGAAKPDAKAAQKDEKPAPEKKPATTGASGAPPEQHSGGGADLPPLDTTKLSPAQYAQYNRNRTLFREQYKQGLIKPARA